MNRPDNSMNNPAMESFFNPRSIAIIGASSDFRKPGGRSLNALLKWGFPGKLYPINPNAKEIRGLTSYPTLLDVPGDIDMAIVSTPVHTVLDRLRQCVEKKVKAVVVFTSGFAETGGAGRALQEKMTEFSRRHNLRILGPNSVGIVNLNKSVMASFANIVDLEAVYPMTLGFVTQSGAFGTMIFSRATQAGVGFSSFVSVGNEADTEFADYLSYMLTNPETKVIGGYLEGAKNGAKFRKAAEYALGVKKPIMIMKVGRTGAGARAASSHTGSLAGDDQVYDAFFRQMGIIRIESLDELTSFVIVHRSGRMPSGKNIGILSISGGAGVLMADKAESLGLHVPEFKGVTRRKLESYLPPFGSARNPVDITAAAVSQPEMLGKCLRALVADPKVHMIAVAMGFMPHMAPIVAKDLIEIYRSTDKPIVLTTYVFNPSEAVTGAIDSIRAAGIPVLSDHLHAIQALKNLAWYSVKAAGGVKKANPVRIKPDGKSISLLRSADALSETDAKKVLASYGIPVTREFLAPSAQSAVKAARQIGYPVALKIVSPQIRHKTEIGGVKLNLGSDREVRAAFRELVFAAKKQSPGAEIRGVLVQEMVGQGIEVIIGATKDPVFGQVMMFGLGGIFVEALKDVSFRIAPLTRTDAEEMVREIRGNAVLQGMRGQPPADLDALVDTILKVSRLLTDHGDVIRELDINPLLVSPRGAVVVDALMIKD